MSLRVSVKSLEGFAVEATDGRRRVVLDLGVAEGGTAEKGMGTHETLLAALGGCTAMTLGLYARRKGWPLEGVELDLSHAKPPVGSGDAPERIEATVRLRGPLDDAQRARLMEIARKCPVYRTLTQPVEIVETLAS